MPVTVSDDDRLRLRTWAGFLSRYGKDGEEVGRLVLAVLDALQAAEAERDAAIEEARLGRGLIDELRRQIELKDHRIHIGEEAVEPRLRSERDELRAEAERLRERLERQAQWLASPPHRHVLENERPRAEIERPRVVLALIDWEADARARGCPFEVFHLERCTHVPDRAPR